MQHDPRIKEVLGTMLIIVAAPIFMIIGASNKKVYLIWTLVENWILIIWVLKLQKTEERHVANTLFTHSLFKILRYYCIWKKIVCDVLEDGEEKVWRKR